jgi:hypothetical protein
VLFLKNIIFKRKTVALAVLRTLRVPNVSLNFNFVVAENFPTLFVPFNTIPKCWSWISTMRESYWEG